MSDNQRRLSGCGLFLALIGAVFVGAVAAVGLFASLSLLIGGGT